VKARVALLAIAVGVVLAGCGGGSDQTSTLDTGAKAGVGRTTPLPSTTPSAPEEVKRGRPKDAPDGKDASPGSPSGKRDPAVQTPSGPAPTASAPLPNEGTKEVAPGVATTEDGDNSIQHYGAEAASTERIEAATTVQAYLSAQAEGQWEQACSLLVSRLVDRMTQLSTRLKEKAEGKGCPAMMAALTAQVPAATLRTAAEINVLSFRVSGTHAFLIYTNGDGTPYSVLMEPEGGTWKLASVAGNQLIR
jgi:hypothetical protein